MRNKWDCRRTTGSIHGRTTSVLVLIWDVVPDFGVNVRLAGSEELFQMPASPVCRDTLVLATVGAALNMVSMFVPDRHNSADSTVGLVRVTALTALVCIDIKHPLLLSGNSNNILMRELFPHLRQKASPLKNIFEIAWNSAFIRLPIGNRGGLFSPRATRTEA
jgi:hypothetical protein